MATALLLKQGLSTGWVFREASQDTWLPAEVPGCVHADLLRNGRIPDPYFGTNEGDLQWIGEKDWVYQAGFRVAPELLQQQHVELAFQGLDTYASVTLNGESILEANNMFRVWRTDCKAALLEGNNRLSIRFRNVFGETMPWYEQAPYRRQAFATNDQADIKLAMYSRKAQFHYGWDWGPRLITCGVWRPVALEAWSGHRIRSVFVQQEQVTADGADILSFVEIDSDAAQTVAISVTMDGQLLHSGSSQLHSGANRIALKGHLPRPTRWWTSGLGGQHLYDYRLTVESAAGHTDEYSTRIGIRSLEVVREKDASGTSFFVRLNGVPVFMKGANYVPLDNFQSRVTPQRHEVLIRNAAEAHMNMLRVWGGGIYEDDAFYEACDRQGILIWQDLQFACAMYPADEPFLENVRAELRDNIRRLRNHACLALYCGNNENDLGWHTAWKQLYPASVQADYERHMRSLFEEFIPGIVKELDPTRYYHPTSPNVGFAGRSPGDGDVHYWGVWHGQEPFEKYAEHVARFVSEYGFQSYPELSTVKKFTAPQDRQLHSAAMLAHQRCTADERKDKEYGNRLIQAYLDRWYRPPRDFEAYLYVSQVMQADGVRLAMEAHRRAMPYCMGSLYWQIDDCWPVASWSSMDYFGRWKALHYTARRCFAPVLISPVLGNEEAKFWIVSDHLAPLQATLQISVRDFDGREIFGRRIPVIVRPNCSAPYLSLSRRELTRDEDERRLVLDCRLEGGGRVIAEDIRYFRLPKELELSRPELAVGVTPSADGFSLELSCRSLARSVMLSCGDDEGFFSDNYFDLLPGERKQVSYQTGQPPESVKKQLRTTSLIDSYER